MTTVEEWFETRDRLSHDVLKNRVMVALGQRPHGVKSFADLEPYLQLFVAHEHEFHELLDKALIVLRPGDWLAGWMGSSLDEEGADVLSEFINVDFNRTSSLCEKSTEIKKLLEQTFSAARQVMNLDCLNVDDSTIVLEMMIQKLSDALTKLPSSMTQVVESMK